MATHSREAQPTIGRRRPCDPSARIIHDILALTPGTGGEPHTARGARERGRYFVGTRRFNSSVQFNTT